MPKTVNTRIAVLQEKQLEMTQAIEEIKQVQKEQSQKLDEIKTMLLNNFVTRAEHEEYLASTQRALELSKSETDKKLDLAKKAAFLRMIAAVIITSIITALIYNFILHGHDSL